MGCGNHLQKLVLNQKLYCQTTQINYSRWSVSRIENAVSQSRSPLMR